MTAGPDRGQGLLETVLIHGRRPVALDAHLERLGRSLATQLGAPLPEDARERAIGAARGVDSGRMRLVVAPDGGGCRTEVGALAPGAVFPRHRGAVDLRGFRRPGGLGAHKWADRSAVPATADGSTPLLLDDTGEVLEAAWANVFAAGPDGALRTPPLDGRILPGVTRAAVVEIAREAGIEVKEERLRPGALLGASEVFLTASIRGVVPARSLDGAPIPGGELAPLIASRLRARWCGDRDADRAVAPAGAS